MTVSTIIDVEFGEELPAFEPDTSLANVKRFAVAAGWDGPRFTDHEYARKEGLPGALVPGIMSQGFLSAMNNSSMLLTFIFDADQLDSQRLAPIVAEFAKSSRFYLKSYAKDGKSLPAIKKAGTLNQAVIDQYFTGISMAYPLLVAMNHQGEQRILSQGVSDKTTIIARLSAFYQQTQLLDLDTRMAKAYWEDQVEEAMKKTTNNLAQ